MMGFWTLGYCTSDIGIGFGVGGEARIFLEALGVFPGLKCDRAWVVLVLDDACWPLVVVVWVDRWAAVVAVVVSAVTRSVLLSSRADMGQTPVIGRTLRAAATWCRVQ